MEDFEKNLEKYADLTVRVGVNIQKGQTLVVNAPIATADFVRKIAEKAYKAGAKNVHVEWNDEKLTLIKYLNAPDEAFKEYPMWKAKGYEEMAKEGAAFLSIIASNPDLLKNVDSQRIADNNKTASTAMSAYRHYSQNDMISWCVVSVPTKEWAAKVFPEANADECVDKLWKAIFDATRVSTEDPIEAWKTHVATMNKKLSFLNNKKFKKLNFKSPITDLHVELPDGHIWVGAQSANAKGDVFTPNIPTEEVFTLPLKEGVNGYVTSTKPLNYGGNLIENFKLTFKDGKIVDFTAETGYETLKKLIETDEGSHYLGEVALIPYDSPISNLNIIFFNTLFDENASNHFAIGNAYPTCLNGGDKMSEEELKKNGANVSLTHVDFMTGSSDMNIDGETADGRMEPIFRNGNWAI